MKQQLLFKVIVSAGFVAVSLIIVNSKLAAAFSWVNDDIAISISDESRPRWTQSFMKNCTYTDVDIYQTELQEKACVIVGEKYSFARFNAYGCAQMCYAILKPGSSVYYRVDLRKDQLPVFFSGKDRVVFLSKMFNGSYFYGPVLYNDITDLLYFNDMDKTYSINMTDAEPDYSILNQDGSSSFATYIGSSADGSYIMYGTQKGLYILNSNNPSIKLVSRGEWNLGDINGSISNNGSLAVVGGRYFNRTKLISLSACGTNVQYVDTLPSSEALCNVNDLSYLVNTEYGDQWYKNFEFIDQTDAITFTYDLEDGYAENFKKIRIGKSQQSYSMDYLALGDSYSSGEGDIGKLADGSSFYIQGTETPGGCHLSSRSYPYLLATRENVAAERMHSIACSGARVALDYYGDGSSYLGQGNAMQGLTQTEISSRRGESIAKFSPGVVKQIEFVKTYKPKVITITGGGNDVGFIDILKGCVFAFGPSERLRTCDEAVLDTKKRSLLGDAIRSQYETISSLIGELKLASPDTTIYVIGYPTFTSGEANNCLNAATLNFAERATINESIHYLNEILQSAARSKGAQYINIEDALVGGRICEGSEYVTGALNVATHFEQLNNMFHPNSHGHIKMADSIMAGGFKIEPKNNPAPLVTTAPDKPTTFGTSNYVPTFQEKLLRPDSVLEVGRLIGLVNPLHALLSAGDRIAFTLYSQPTSLGSYAVSSDGTINATVRIPTTVSPGQHMIVAAVTSNDKVVKRYYQFVEIGSGVANDKDGDGIVDADDRCLYLKVWYDESTGKDICKVDTETPDVKHDHKRDYHPNGKWTPASLFKLLWEQAGTHNRFGQWYS